MGDRRPVLIGEAPGREDITSRPEYALAGQTGQRIASLAMLAWQDYLRDTDRRNLFSDPQPQWNATRAKARATEMLPSLAGRRVILLGAKVAAAFSSQWYLGGVDLYTWLTIIGSDTRVAKVPHPSGRNRVFNDLSTRAHFGSFMHEAICEH